MSIQLSPGAVDILNGSRRNTDNNRQGVDNSLAAWRNWAQQTYTNAKDGIMHGGRVVQTVHLTFAQSCAQGLNGFLDSKIQDGDVKASKAILFNTSTAVLVATVALYILGSVSFLGAAALIALSLLGRAVVLESFNPLKSSSSTHFRLRTKL